MTHWRGRGFAALVAGAILVAGVGLAVVDSLRYRTDLRADTLERVQSEADQVAGALTQISRESRTLAAASRDGEAFAVAVDDVRSRNNAVMGALVLDDWVMRHVTMPTVPAGTLAMMHIQDGERLEIDETEPGLAAPLRSVLEDGGLLLAGPLPVDPLPFSLTLIVDRAPAVEGVPDQRLLLLLLDMDEVLASLPPASNPGRALETAIMLDGGTAGLDIEDLEPKVVRGEASTFDDGVQASAGVAGVQVLAAGRPEGGWPATSPAVPMILLPSILGAGLGWLTVERRRTERARLHQRVEVATADVRRARAREQATIEHSPDGLLGVDGDVVVSANPAAAALLGAPPAHLIDQRLSELLRHDGELTAEGTEVRRDGRVLLVRASAVPTGLDEDAHRRVVTLHDVTGERRSATLLRRYTRKLEQVNAQYDELEAVRGDLVAKVSHEIRTPLTVIGGVAELLRADDLSEQQRDDLMAAFQRQLTRLQEQVQGLLDLAESSRPLSHTAQDTDVGEIVEELAVAVGVACHVEGQATAHVPPDTLRRVLRALLSNAASYGEPPVALTIRAEGDHVHVDVSDAGPGIPEGTDPFVPFAQGDSGDRRTSRGLGVGLAMAQGLARAADGDLQLVSRAAPTTFRVVLPRVPVVATVADGSPLGLTARPRHPAAGAAGPRPRPTRSRGSSGAARPPAGCRAGPRR